MSAWLAHRVRYERLLLLPSVRAIGTIAVATLVAASASAALAPPAAPGAVVLGGVALAAYALRHRPQVELEGRMVAALVRSRDARPRDVEVPALEGEVRAELTADGVTRVEAGSWPDAIRALGYAMGRDRAFQMDLMRRTATGRLAEVWGPTALPIDIRYRGARLAPAARRAAAALEEPERDLVGAFAAGVNAALERHGPPFECRFLSYQPEPWTGEDSLAVALLMFHTLAWNEPARRAEEVIRRTFPEAVASFFLPGEAPREVPEQLARLRAPDERVAEVDIRERLVPGSNCWVVGREPAAPLLACDLHLPLTMPNVVYEVDLGWEGRRLRGLAIPGLPTVVVGTNGHLVWGVTDLSADVLDLVPVGTDGAASLATRTERIRVRGADDVLVEVAEAATMPVSPVPLPGGRVAVRWTGHDPRSGDLKLQRLAHASSVEESVKVLDDAYGAPLNVLVADGAGRMAHLATGLLPRRRAAAPAPHADGHLEGAERPRRIDPDERTLVSANDAALSGRAFRIAYDPDPGHRAARIRQVLAEVRRRGEEGPPAMRALQHDTVVEFYEPYRELAVSALAGRDDELAELLAGWDGTAGADSRAFGVLVGLREILARSLLSPYLAICLEHDPGFEYSFRCVDRPLLAILRSRDPALLPAGERGGWDAFLVRCVHETVRDLRATTRGRRIPRWGELNSVGLDHPMEALAPWSASLLGVAPGPQPGALHAVRTCVPGFGAVGRAVLSPGAGDETSFELPGGQSGHPLSAHYRDRHAGWASTGPSRRARRTRASRQFVLYPAREAA